VRERRLELPCPCGRYHLKVVRLPVSPPAQVSYRELSEYSSFKTFYKKTQPKLGFSLYAVVVSSTASSETSVSAVTSRFSMIRTLFIFLRISRTAFVRT